LPVFGHPLTTDSAVAYASTQLDSAIKYAHDSTRFVVLARVTKGRALLDQGKYTEAAAVVAPVSTGDVYNADGYNFVYNDYPPGNWDPGNSNVAVGERKGINGMPFASARDPRIPTVVGGVSANDTTDTLYQEAKYTDNQSPMPLASGVEARLIEAEAALHANDGTWLTILNTLRSTAVSPALGALSDPGTPEARVDLLYHERAFWLYLTGRRLGDMRRLIKNYQRDPETVFPTGPYPGGGSYGSATSIPYILAGQQFSNPYITTGCATR